MVSPGCAGSEIGGTADNGQVTGPDGVHPCERPSRWPGLAGCHRAGDTRGSPVCVPHGYPGVLPTYTEGAALPPSVPICAGAGATEPASSVLVLQRGRRGRDTYSPAWHQPWLCPEPACGGKFFMVCGHRVLRTP